jgi:hypothetical protein
MTEVNDPLYDKEIEDNESSSELDNTQSSDQSENVYPILKIKSHDGDINIVGKYKGEVSVKPINLKFIMATLWWEKAPELETFFNVLELTIKRALQEVYPHHKLVMDYHYNANDHLEDASEIVVEIEEVFADETEVQVEGDSIVLMGKDDRGFLKKITSFRRKVTEEIHKEL